MKVGRVSIETIRDEVYRDAGADWPTVRALVIYRTRSELSADVLDGAEV